METIILPTEKSHRRSHTFDPSSSPESERKRRINRMSMQVKLPEFNLAISPVSVSKTIQLTHLSPIPISPIQRGYAARVSTHKRSKSICENDTVPITGQLSKLLIQLDVDAIPVIRGENYSKIIPLIGIIISLLFILLGAFYEKYYWLASSIFPFVIYLSSIITRKQLSTALKEQNKLCKVRILDERRLVNQLLHDIYPARILQRIRAGEQPILDQYRDTTVLFTDIVGFTKWSSNLSPLSLAVKLNKIYTIFDYLSDKYKVYKVETIGDAYMAVAGCPEKTTDHALRISRFTVSLMGAVEELRLLITKPDLQIRAGIHSGAVVAGVLGSKRHQFHLYGDTVNIASRMESTGLPSEIQISNTTYELLNSSLSTTARGEIQMKGKGLQYTYLLLMPSLINAKDFGFAKPSLNELKYIIAELFIRVCALNTLNCTVDELDKLLEEIFSAYKNHQDLLNKAIYTTIAIHYQLITEDIYHFMTEIESLAVLIVTLADGIGGNIYNILSSHEILARCTNSGVLFTLIRYLSLEPPCDDFAKLTYNLNEATNSILASASQGINGINGIQDKSYILHSLLDTTGNRWKILVSVVRIAQIINMENSNEYMLNPIVLNLIDALKGCMDIRNLLVKRN
jgi:class 3 adenylate cyclase